MFAHLKLKNSVVSKYLYVFTRMFVSPQAVPGQTEAELDNGLICGHAYSITDIKLVSPSVCVFWSLVNFFLSCVHRALLHHEFCLHDECHGSS